jgi:Tol biopolymer transport system component
MIKYTRVSLAISIVVTSIVINITFGRDGIWSPNGQKIAFICVAHHPRSIWTIDSDGSNLKSLDRTTQAVARSPDSRKIAFADLASEPNSLAIIDADGSGFKQLTYRK